MAKRRRSDLPFGSQFSPSQIYLPRVLELVHECGGTTQQFTERIRQEFFSHHADGDKQQQLELAKNVRLALRGYGIVGEDERFTGIGRELYGLRQDGDRLLAALAQQILLHGRGLDLCRAIISLRTLGDEPTLLALAKELKRGGLYVPASGTHISTMKQWLQNAGVIDEDLEVNEERLRELIGYGLEDLDELASFSPLQRAFLRALASLAPENWTSSADVARHAEMLAHVEFNPKDLPKQVLFPLRDGGYIELRKSTSGRGAKPYEVRPTEKFRIEHMEPILAALAELAGVPYEVLRAPLDKALEDLGNPEKHVKGKALEKVAIHLTRLLDLRFVAWRHRWTETGGAEVDHIAEGTNLAFARWQIQCKNTPTVSHGDVAREVGLVDDYRSNVVMLVTTGKFSGPAKTYVENRMKKSHLNFVLVDGRDLRRIAKDPAWISLSAHSFV